MEKYLSLNDYERVIIRGREMPKVFLFDVFDVIDYFDGCRDIDSQDTLIAAHAVVHCVLEGDLHAKDRLFNLIVSDDVDIYRYYHAIRPMLQPAVDCILRSIDAGNVLYYRLTNDGFLRIIEVHPLMAEISEERIYYGELLMRSAHAIEDIPY